MSATAAAATATATATSPHSRIRRPSVPPAPCPPPPARSGLRRGGPSPPLLRVVLQRLRALDAASLPLDAAGPLMATLVAALEVASRPPCLPPLLPTHGRRCRPIPRGGRLGPFEVLTGHAQERALPLPPSLGGAGEGRRSAIRDSRRRDATRGAIGPALLRRLQFHRNVEKGSASVRRRPPLGPPTSPGPRPRASLSSRTSTPCASPAARPAEE